MMLTKIDKNVVPQEYHYGCLSCGVTSIGKQNKPQRTPYCLKCTNTINPTRLGKGLVGGIYPETERAKQAKRVRAQKLKETNRTCNTCGGTINSCTEGNELICIQCDRQTRGIQSSNTSGYVGVCYIQPRLRRGRWWEQGFWSGKIRINGLTEFSVTYKDSEPGSNEHKKLKCAIDRDIHIREKGLNNFKNFSDEVLFNYVKNGIKDIK